MRLAAVLLAAVPALAAASPGECTTRTGAATHVLVELYTSEGCSSCPPADRWFSALDAPGLVPIAFHVQYWDYLGWRDRFAKQAFTDRQRAFARATNARNVYTPQVILGGRDFPRWRDDALVSKAVGAAAAVAPHASIAITSSSREGGHSVAAEMTLREPLKDATLFLAIVEDGLSSRVTAGENRGESLRHDRVARELYRAAPGETRIATNFRPRQEWNAQRLSYVAFVQDARTGAVLQALSAPLCRS